VKNLKAKKERFGIKLPNSEVEKIVFVFGVTHSDRHIQLVNEGNSISTHTTIQDEQKRDHIGRLFPSEISEQFWFNVLKPRKLSRNDLNKQVFYLTKNWERFFDMPKDKFFKKKENETEIISYLDLDELFKEAFAFVQQFASSSERFLGYCMVKEMLSYDEIEIGLLDNKKAIIKIEGELWEIDLSSIQDIFNMPDTPNFDNPLLAIWKNLGLMSLNEDLLNRFKATFPKADVNTRA